MASNGKLKNQKIILSGSEGIAGVGDRIYTACFIKAISDRC